MTGRETAAEGALRLWYTAPARAWTEALPVGNGRLGAMVYGGVFHNTKLNDRIQLNIDTLWWRCEAADRHNPDALDGFREVRRLLLAGRIKDAEHPALVALYFQFGRYLLIASSRPGTLPANLQGIWNESFVPPWESKYTININAEMNDWPAEVCNLSECHEPLFDFIDRMAANGRTTAQRLYGCRGFVAHNNLDGFADTAVVGEPDGAFMWPMGAAWLTLHLWEHYRFSGDEEFLRRRAYPLLAECATFFIDYLHEDEEGRLLTGPSLSPELSYRLEDGTPAAVCMAPAMDCQILHELFGALLRASEILGEDPALREQVAAMKANVPLPRAGDHGRLLEWQEDHPEADVGHRHISHLFAVFPGTQIGPAATPGLARAARLALERRIEHGGEIHLLPALPSAWPTGSVRGLCARGGFEVDIAWRGGALTEATIRSRCGGPCRIRCGKRATALDTQAGGSYVLDAELDLTGAQRPR